MEFGWRIVLGSLIGIFGAASGSVGGVGGGGIFLPMLALIIGFDPKSSAAMSKCEHLDNIIRRPLYISFCRINNADRSFFCDQQ